MAARTVVSYDDITLPYDHPEPPSHSPKPNGPPPSKKRKKNTHQKGKHWADGPAKNAPSAHRAEFTKYPSGVNPHSKLATSSSTYSDGAAGGEDAREEYADEGEYYEDAEAEESRELTHEEIWDDSALVYAWESAMEEYKSYHGGEDAWKTEPVKKSPLWYNIPIDISEKLASAPTPAVIIPPIAPSTTKEDDAEEDSKPLNFDTFVPSHDPSLENTSVPITENNILDTSAGGMVSQDEAFQRALNAMYWGGYWTAIYHAQRQIQTSQPTAPETSTPSDNVEEEDEEGEDEGIEVDDDDDFISTQR